jgi:hypothetical protein
MTKMNRCSQTTHEGARLSRSEALRRAARAGALISLSTLGLGIPASTEAAEGETFGKFPSDPQGKFVFVNHVTTNPFLSRQHTVLKMPAPFWDAPTSGPDRKSPLQPTWLTP